jgi:hypothetical protein
LLQLRCFVSCQRNPVTWFKDPLWLLLFSSETVGWFRAWFPKLLSGFSRVSYTCGLCPCNLCCVPLSLSWMLCGAGGWWLKIKLFIILVSPPVFRSYLFNLVVLFSLPLSLLSALL